MKKFIIEYRDSREGNLRKTEIIAKDSSLALYQAQNDDYYFGQLLSIEEEEL
jgi:hypothetical protein